MQDWCPIEGYDKYSVSTEGRVRNDNTGRIIQMSQNQRGIVQVGLSHKGIVRNHGVALLVARAFLGGYPQDYSTSIIHLDGDRSNCSVQNLKWRPRWFAVMYHKQFTMDTTPRIIVPIREVKTGQTFSGSRDAAKRYGILERDIFHSVYNGHVTAITYQTFELVTV